MQIEQEIYLDYDDVLIKPRRSELASRKDVNLIREYSFRWSPRLIKGTGIIVANMATIGNFNMAKTMASSNMFCALHKFYSEKELLEFYNGCSEKEFSNTFYTTGISEEDLDKLKSFMSNFADINVPNILIDIANFYSSRAIPFLKEIRKLYPYSIIMAGNVATPDMAQEIIMSGADIVKIGLGSGANCNTRLAAAVGVPQLTANIKCSNIIHGINGHICADGGIKEIGDISKAFASGADFVMCGSMFAGTDLSEGEWKEVDRLNSKVKFFKHYGMSSKHAQEKHYQEIKDYRASEGFVKWIKYKGKTQDLIKEIQGGIRSCCTYIGAKSIKDIPKCTTFLKINRIK